MTMYVQDMVAAYLKENGFEGLHDFNGECCCELKDLAPCGEMQMTCMAGYKNPCNCGEGCDFHIGARRRLTEAEVKQVQEVAVINEKANASGLSITACVSDALDGGAP